MRLAHLMVVAALLGCAGARPSLDERIAHSGIVAKKAGALIEQADRHVETQALEKADGSLAEARELIADPEMVYYLDQDALRERLKQAEIRLASAREAQRQRALELRVAEQKREAQKVLQELAAGLKALTNRDELARKTVARAREAAEAAGARLRDGERLEKEDTAYASWAQDGRKQVAQALERVAVAQKLTDFLEGPAADEAAARGLAEKANGEAKGAPEERKKLLSAAREKYLACAASAASVLSSPPDVSREVLPAAAAKVKTTAKAFAASCEARAKAMDQALNPAPSPGPQKRPAAAKRKPR